MAVRTLAAPLATGILLSAAALLIIWKTGLLTAAARHYLAAGTLKPGFRRSTRGAGRAAAKGRDSCAVTRNGSAATIRCGGSHSSRSHWAGCHGSKARRSWP